MAPMTVDDNETRDLPAKARWSANKKLDAVMRFAPRREARRGLLRAGRRTHRLAAWRDEFMERGKARLKGRFSWGREPEDRAIRQAERR